MNKSTPVPIYGFLEGDTVGLVVLARTDMTIFEVLEKLQSAASVRVARRENLYVTHRGREIDPAATVADTGIEPLDRFDVRRRSI